MGLEPTTSQGWVPEFMLESTTFAQAMLEEGVPWFFLSSVLSESFEEESAEFASLIDALTDSGCDLRVCPEISTTSAKEGNDGGFSTCIVVRKALMRACAGKHLISDSLALM